MDAKQLWASFEQQFHRQLLYSAPPTSEHAIHLYLATGLVAAGVAAAGEIVFERPVANRRRVDIWLSDEDVAIEVKFWRPIPSGKSRPWTQLLGGLLSDFNKVAREPFAERWVLLVSDVVGRRYLERSSSALIPPLTHGRYRTLAVADVQRLALTAARSAIDDGPWTDLSLHLVWETQWDDWCALAWRVEPIAHAEVNSVPSP